MKGRRGPLERTALRPGLRPAPADRRPGRLAPAGVSALRRSVLAILAGLLACGAAAPGGTPPAPATGKVPAGTAKRSPAPQAAPAQGQARRPAAPDARAAALRPPKPGARIQAREPEDAPGLRPIDREQVQGWLAANPDWTPPALPPGRTRRLARGKPLPPGTAGQALPPELAMRLPYFPGYRYLAVGTDLVLVSAANGTVTSLLPGALAR